MLTYFFVATAVEYLDIIEVKVVAGPAHVLEDFGYLFPIGDVSPVLRHPFFHLSTRFAYIGRVAVSAIQLVDYTGSLFNKSPILQMAYLIFELS